MACLRRQEPQSAWAPTIIAAYIAQPEQAATVAPERLDELSPRELEVLGLVARGSTNREIAEALYLSPLTVKTHVSRILTKLRARDRVQLVVIAYQAGLVSPERRTSRCAPCGDLPPPLREQVTRRISDLLARSDFDPPP